MALVVVAEEEGAAAEEVVEELAAKEAKDPFLLILHLQLSP